MLVSFRWMQTAQRAPRVSQKLPISRTLLTTLSLATALTAAAGLCGSAANAAPFDDTTDPNGTASVLLHEPGENLLVENPADESALFATDAAQDPDAGEASADPTWSVTCTAGASEPCGCPACRGETILSSAPSTGLLGTVGGACADRLCEPRGPLADYDPRGLIQRLAHRHKTSGACWTGRADLLLMWRNAPPPAALISAYDPGTGTIGGTVLDASDLESALAAGPRFTLMRTNACGHGFETTYFRAFNFRSQQELPIVVDGYALTPPGVFGNNFTNLSGAAANLGSGIQSFELNGRRQVFKNLALLGGFRWVEWRESLSLLDAAVDPGTGDIAFDNYSTDCMNSLYGGQIGFDTRLVQLGSWLRVDSWMKGGAYYNNAVQTSVYSSGVVGGPADPPVQASAQVGAAAFVGEIGMMGTIPITRNLDFQFGYLGLWLESLAQPTNQLFGQTLVANQAPVGSITTTGGTVVQGLTLGLQGRW